MWLIAFGANEGLWGSRSARRQAKQRCEIAGRIAMLPLSANGHYHAPPRLAARPPCEFKLRAYSEPGVAMTERAVVIAGAGPTGLMLAGELGLAKVDVVIVERRASQELAGSRAGGLQSRTIEVLDQRGIADRFLLEGQVAQVAGFAGTRLDISDFPTRHPYGLALWQNHIERILDAIGHT